MSDETAQLLIDMQVKSPEFHPYIFVSPERLARLKKRRKADKWNSRSEVVNNLHERFNTIRHHGNVAECTMHDLRRTAITNWFYEGLEIVEVMRLAGHAKYDTTLQYYLAVKDDLVDKARRAVRHRFSPEMLKRCLGRGE